MTEADVLSLVRDALRTGTIIVLPILIAALVAGLAIGLLQALTSIQELTLTFVPKLLVIILTFWVTAGFMAVGLLNLFEGRILPLLSG